MDSLLTIPFRNELIVVNTLQNGDFKITFLDRTERILKNRLDENQDILWYLDDDRDYSLAEELGRLIDDNI